VRVQRIFVGDIQGCADELDELLDRATSRFGKRFELWSVGDLINRGPANLRVLERIHDLWDQGRAFPVLGNHEIALLRTALGLRRLGRLDTIGEVLDSPDASFWFEWLRALPLVRGDQIEGEPFLMVHAAAFPRLSLEATLERARKLEARLRSGHGALRKLLASAPADDRAASRLGYLVSCRSLDSAGGWSEVEPGPRPGAGSSGPRVAWHERFDPRREGYGVVYGHWSQQGLHVAPGLRGLDTGCVHHGRSGDGFLTAWLPGRAGNGGAAKRTGAFGVPDDRFWQVRGHRQYLPSFQDS